MHGRALVIFQVPNRSPEAAVIYDRRCCNTLSQRVNEQDFLCEVARSRLRLCPEGRQQEAFTLREFTGARRTVIRKHQAERKQARVYKNAHPEVASPTNFLT
ncbi:hypothetical protein NDU88_006352 [Pleurodeles waltl]|uniref:Uncharacterized protein n=1 Tax=Pleurodeles waltl TaxID=8319 RepID=A0AAV7PL65_PLEWA|nr:hypothetical protein NDU88_006352 [Pleurodeles waltl]